MDDRKAALLLALLALAGAGVRLALAPANRARLRAAHRRVARAAWSVRRPDAVRQRAGGGAEAPRELASLRDVFGGDPARALTSLRRQLCYAVHFQRVAYGDRGSYLRQAG